MIEVIDHTIERLSAVEAMLRGVLSSNPCIQRASDYRSALLTLRDIADGLRTERLRHAILAAQEAGWPRSVVGQLDGVGLSWSEDVLDRGATPQTSGLSTAQGDLRRIGGIRRNTRLRLVRGKELETSSAG